MKWCPQNLLIERVLELCSEEPTEISVYLSYLEDGMVGFDFTITHQTVFSYYYQFNLNKIKDYDTALWNFKQELISFARRI